MECIFCEIAAGRIPCHKLAETPSALAFLDIMPVTRGHVLVIPKQHVGLAYEADPVLMGELMTLATRLARAAQTALRCDGMNLLVNCGSCAGQVVPHVHLHVIPRYAGDGIQWPWPQGKLDHAAAAALVAQITQQLDGCTRG